MKKGLKAFLAIILSIALNLSLIVAASAEISYAVSAIGKKISLNSAGEVSTWDGTSSTAPVLTDGIYIIDSAAKLRGFADAISNGTTYAGYTVKITVNIDLNGKTWNGAAKDRGDSAYAFKGTLDGSGYYISNYINTDYGFFRYLNGATVKNILFKNVNLSSTTNGNRYAGGLASSSRGINVIDNVDYQDCYFNYTYSSSTSGRHSQNGGVIGIVDDGTLNITNCDYTNVTGYSQDARSGMLVGDAASGTTININTCSFNNAYFYANSNRCSDLAMCVGMSSGTVNFDGITFTNNSRVVGYNDCGALIGQGTSNVTAKNITATGLSVTSSADRVGGLTGIVSGTLTIENVNATNLTVSSNSNDTAGISGYVNSSASMKNISISGGTFKNNGTCLGCVVGYINSGSSFNFEKITLSGNISLTATGGDYCGDIVANNSSSAAINFYDINTKDAVITRNVSNKSDQAHVIAYSNGDVYIGTKDMTMNELGNITCTTGGNMVGGVAGYINGKSIKIENTRINGNINAYAALDSGTYDNAGGLVCDVDGTCDIKNVIVTGNINVKGDENLGGFIGYAGGKFTFESVSVVGNINIITTNQNVGGLVGKYNPSTATTIDGLNIPSVTITATSGGKDVGGFVGWDVGALTIKNCSLGTVTINTQSNDVGGLVGGCSGVGVNVSDTHLGTVNLTATGEIIGGVVAVTNGESNLSGVSIDSVTLNNNTTNTGYGEVGGFIGSANGKTTISNCSITSGTVSGPYRLGGAVGLYNSSGNPLVIENYNNAISVTTNLTGTTENDGNVGGVIGDINAASAATITGCSNSATITSSSTTTKTKYFGGIVGRSNVTTLISNSYNSGTISGNSCDGGIIGYAQGSVTVDYCYNKGLIQPNSSNALSSSYYSAGGIACWVTGASTIEYCFNRGNVLAYSASGYYDGGIVGHLNNSSAKVQYCYTTGNITSESSTYFRGTVVGKNSAGTVNYCYSSVSGSVVGSGSSSNTSYIAPASLQGSNYVANTQLGTVYFTTDSSLINDKYPILYWMGDPFVKNSDGIWEIWNVGHYSQFLNKVNAGITFAGETVRLMDDVDLSTLDSTTSIGGNGNTTYSFQGTFDGNNHAFSNFTLNNGTTSYTGFFGYVKNAVIKDLIIDNFKITGGQYTGGLIGYADGTVTLTNITVHNGIVVNGAQYCGGITGYSSSKFSLNGFTSTGTVDVNGGQFTGGLLGYTPANIVLNGISTGIIDVDSTSEYVGGLVGMADGTDASNVTDINASGTIYVNTTSGSYIGGIAGRVDGNFTVGSSSGTSVLSGIVVGTQNGSNVGGIVGNHTDSSATNTVKNIKTGDVSATGTGSYISGLIAYSTNAANMQNVEMGNVTISASSGSSCGAFVGWTKSTSTIDGTNKTGDITITSSGKYIAGILGEADSNVSISGITTGNITINGGSNTDVAGFTGNVTGTTSVSGCSSKIISLYGTGNTRGGIIGYSESSASVSSTNADAVVIGTSDSKASTYNGGYIGFSNSTASVNNVTVANVTIYSSGDCCGGLIGKASSTVAVSDANLTNINVNGAANGGGIIGYCVGATLNNVVAANCYLNLTGNYKGGFVGRSDGNGNITFTGNISMSTISINNSNNSYVGMFAGFSGGKLTINTSSISVPSSFFYCGSSDNSIEQVGAVGGYVGSADIKGITFNSVTIGTQTLRAKYYIGGFFGKVGGDLSVADCSVNDMKVYTGSNYSSGGTFSHSSSISYTGGIVGYVNGSASISNLTLNSLILTAEGENVGGIIGQCSGTSTFTNVKILGDQSSLTSKMFDFGGFIGYSGNSVTASDCINHASLTFNESRAYNSDNKARIGGLAGRVESGTSSFTNCKNYGNITLGIDFKYAGGIVASIDGTLTFTNCENYGVISSSGSYVGGIIGQTGSDVVISGGKNLANITATSLAGGLIGETSAKIDIDNSYNSASITSNGSYAGGLIANMSSANTASTVDNCYNTGTITANGSYGGGLFGVGRTTVRDSYNTGTITGKDKLGGISGYMDNVYTYSNLNNSGTLSGTEYVGGIIGNANSSSLTLSSCYNTGSISNTGSYTGGIIGGTNTGTGSTVSKCYNTATVNGVKFVGGITGQSYSAVSQCFNTGNITSTSTDSESYVGGVLGSIQGSSSASHCYNIGDITVNSAGKAGGIVGTLDGTLSDSYNAGTMINSNSTTGATVGYLYTTASGATASVYGISGKSVGSANGSNDSTTIVTPEVLQKMTQTSLSTDYFTPIHYFNKSYPVLKWYLDNNDHSVLDADYVKAKTCNSNETVNNIYKNYDEVITPVLEEINAHGKYLTQDEINIEDAKLKAALSSLTENSADYSELLAALKTVPSNLYYYTAASAQAVRNAVNAVVYNLGITHQSEVDTMTQNIINAVSALKVIEYTVTVNGTDSTVSYSPSTSSSIPYKKATVTTPSVKDGKNFSYWVDVTDGSEKIVSTYRNYTFYVCKNVTLSPVYGVDYTPAIIASRVLNVRDNGNGTAAILVEHSVSKSIDIIAHGVLFTSDSTAAGNLVVGSDNEKIFDAAAATTAATRTGLLEITIKNGGGMIYARPYIIEKNGTVHYGDVSQYDTSSMSTASMASRTISTDEFAVDTNNGTDSESNGTSNINPNAIMSIVNSILSIIKFILSLFNSVG
jgi:hypothetical protein